MVLNVLALNYEYPPIGGGGGNAHRHILQEFTHFHDLEVTLITSTMQPDLMQINLSNNVRIHGLPLKKRERLYWRRSEVLRYLLLQNSFLKKFLKHKTFDVCHVFFGFPTGFLAYKQRHHFPYVVSVRGSDVPGYNKRFSLDYILLGPLLKRIYGKAHSVVANSHGLRKLYETHYKGWEAGVIPNGIDIERFKPINRSPNKDVSLVTVARLIPRKGIDLLIRACKRLNDESFSFVCHIIGEGPEEKSLRKLTATLGLQENIRFHGAMQPEQIASFLPQCDLFVLPSFAEGMSNAALEAMACGLPLLLTDTGGSGELIHQNGMVVPCGDEEAISHSLKEMLTHPEQLHLMGEASRKHAHDFSWRNVAEQYRDLFYKAAGQSPS